MRNDLFVTYKLLPLDIQYILERYNELDIRMGLTYTNLIQMGKDLAIYGYEFDFDLDCIPYNLRKITK